MKLKQLIAALIISVALSSCASQSYKELDSFAIEPISKQLDIKFYKQLTNECGPVSLFTITQFFNSTHKLEQIKAITYTPSAQGSLKSDMLAASRRLGFAPYKLETLPMALTAITQNYPVLVFQNLGLSFKPNWHYSVLVGFDANAKEVSLHDGKDAYAKQTFKRFANAWERGDKWAYIISPTSRIPSLANYQQVMSNVQVFLDIEDSKNARSLLLEAKKRWPERYEIETSLSNLYFSLKDLKQAQIHAKNAITLAPTLPGLYYNLAYIQLSANQIDAAKRAKEQALKLSSDAGEISSLKEQFSKIGL